MTGREQDAAAVPPPTPPEGLGDLADPSRYHDAVALDGVPGETLRTLLERMLLIRATEERIGDLSATGEARCPCHLAIGQEAAAVGVAAALDLPRDRLFGAHRSHAHFLAVEGDVDELVAEVLGKVTGCSRGMGGSMHLVAPDRGLLGTVPIVGATIPMAVGAGLVSTLSGDGGVAVTFFGDGATEEGIFHESMNFAAAHTLPVVFACENNLFSSHLHIRLRQPGDSLARYAEAHRMPWETVDGNDLVAVLRATERAVARAREGGGPTFLEMVTYRWRGHVGPREDLDVGVERDEHLPEWKKRDPIDRLARGLAAEGLLDAEALEGMKARVEERVDRAVERARAADYPDPSATARFMWAEAAG